MSDDAKGDSTSNKMVLMVASLSTAIIVVFTFVHSMVTVPNILLKVQEMLTERMNEHQQRGHPELVTREELQITVLSRIDSLATKDQINTLIQRLDRMEVRLEKLESK